MSHDSRSPFRATSALLLGLSFGIHITQLAAEELVISDKAVVNTGHHVYMRHCAVCHGRDGEGRGAYATMLVVAPTDLTTLARRNDGLLPLERIEAAISGNELMPAHGTREMPIWGQRFSEEAENLGINNRALVRARILELITYLQHIQKN